MKIVIAPDSFKESLSAAQVAAAIAGGLAEVWPEAELVACPMADGGEGTVDAVLAASGGERRSSMVAGPFGAPLEAAWGWLPATRTAVIEMAAASGLMLVPVAQRDASAASSAGTGDLIRAALDAGAERIVLGIGGSATNDGGAGLLAALGVRFLDAQGVDLAPGGAALAQLVRIDIAGLDARLQGLRFEVAADVDHPLCGARGASAVFGPQKGASPAQVLELDAALGHYADVCAMLLGADHRDFPGTGAAGGMGFAMKAFFGAAFRPGVAVVAELNRLAELVAGADWVITGEGRLDAQTLGGKTPFGVARIAHAAGVPVIALAGSLGEGYAELYGHGIEACFSLVPGPMPLEQACAQAAVLLRERARDIGRLLRAAIRR